MRRTLAALVVLAAFFTQPAAHADDAAKRAKAERLIVVTKSDAMIQTLIDQMGTSIKAQAAQQESSFQITPEHQIYLDKYNNRIAEIMKESLSMDKLRPVFVQVYVDTYTESELDGIIAFYESPAGQAFVNKGPQMMQRSFQLMEQQMADLTPKLEAATREFTDALAKDAAPKN